ncbi:DUF3054 domain-containing protein [Arthrobacter sp. MPF02]|uniref:DUF3054 domain-containing protein n=1 Tax=Arthrobacter sp. MPF02 TaxID=3388492 RepID=UPI003984A546
MSFPNAKPAGTAPPVTVAGAALTDALLILVFAAIGRDAHQRGDVVAGVLLTAWPFLAGAAAGWLITRAWRHPLSVPKAGIGVWLGSLVVGMLLRAITGQTVVLPFVIVALVSLGVLLLGYRLVIFAFRRRKSA